MIINSNLSANISKFNVDENSTLAYLETIFTTTLVSENISSSKPTSTSISGLRTGYIFSFVLVFLIVLFGIVGRVIYSSNERPPIYIYEKYQRSISLPNDDRRKFSVNSKNNENELALSYTNGAGKKKDINKKKIQEAI